MHVRNHQLLQFISGMIAKAVSPKEMDKLTQNGVLTKDAMQYSGRHL